MTRGRGYRGEGSVAPWQFNDVHAALHRRGRTWECGEDLKGVRGERGRSVRAGGGTNPSPARVRLVVGWVENRTGTLARGYLAFFRKLEIRVEPCVPP